MIENLINFKEMFTCEKSIKITTLGNITAIYINKMIGETFLANQKFVYPDLVLHEEQMKIAFYFEKPRDYSEKIYKLYKIKRKGSLGYYVPIPAQLQRILFKSNKNPLINYKIGVSNKIMMILLEKI